MQPGDIILTDRKSQDFVWRAVRFGSWIRGFEERHRFGHVALVTRNDTVTEALNTGVVQRPNPYDPDDFDTVLVRPVYHPHDLEQVMDFADAVAAARWRYSWLTIIGLGLYCATGALLIPQRAGTAICSGFVADAMTRSGIIWPRQPYSMLPADIAKHFIL